MQKVVKTSFSSVQFFLPFSLPSLCVCVSADNDAVCVCVLCAPLGGARVSNKHAALLIRPVRQSSKTKQIKFDFNCFAARFKCTNKQLSRATNELIAYLKYLPSTCSNSIRVQNESEQLPRKSIYWKLKMYLNTTSLLLTNSSRDFPLYMLGTQT